MMDESERTGSQDRWLQFFNTVVYNTLAPAYNALDWLTLGAWWQLVRRARDYVPANERVLEVGFGPGKLHAALSQQSRLCVGLDRAWGMCHFTARRLQRANLPSRVTRGSVFALPYPTGAFDTVVSTFAVSGFPEAPNAMQEMARVVAPGGRIVIVDIGLPTDGNRTGIFWARLWERMGDYLYDLPALMRDCELAVTACDEYGPGRHIRAVVGEKPSR